MTRTRWLPGGALALGLALACPAAAAPVLEPRTGVAFDDVRSVAGRTFHLVGTGVHTHLGFKVCAIAAYAEHGAGRRALLAAHGTIVPTGRAAHDFYVEGRFPKYGVLHLVRD